MAERIIQVIENPKLAEQMGRAGREHIKKINDPDRRIDAIYRLLERASGRENINHQNWRI